MLNYKYIFICIFVLIIGSLGYFLHDKNIISLFKKPTPLSAKIDDSKKNPEDNRQKDLASLFNQGNYSVAYAQVDDMLSIDKKNLFGLIMKARLLSQEASLTFREKELGDQAMIFINKALEIDTSSPEAITIKGYIFEIQENYVDAHKQYDQAIKIDPNYVPALSQKGHAKQLQGLSDEAKIFYEKSLQINEFDALSLLGLAKILATNGKLGSAKESYLKALDSKEINSRQKAEIYYSVGQIIESQDLTNIVDTERNADLAIGADPSYPNGYVLKAKALFKKSYSAKDEKERQRLLVDSFGSLEKAASLYKNLSIAHIQLAVQLIALGEKNKVRLVVKSLPQIISKDITLSKNDKLVATSLMENINKKIN